MKILLGVEWRTLIDRKRFFQNSTPSSSRKHSYALRLCVILKSRSAFRAARLEDSSAWHCAYAEPYGHASRTLHFRDARLWKRSRALRWCSVRLTNVDCPILRKRAAG